jgi:hypothetical protein
MILVRTDHSCLRVRCHIQPATTGRQSIKNQVDLNEIEPIWKRSHVPFHLIGMEEELL